MSGRLTSGEILSGLMADPRYPDWYHLQMIVDQVIRLPEFMPEGRLAEKVTYRRIMQLSADMLSDLLGRPECPERKGYVWRQITGIRIGWLAAIAMHGDKYDEHEPVLYPNSFNFRMDVELRYLEGTLAFTDLLRLQPGVFVPNIPDLHFDWENETAGNA